MYLPSPLVRLLMFLYFRNRKCFELSLEKCYLYHVWQQTYLGKQIVLFAKTHIVILFQSQAWFPGCYIAKSSVFHHLISHLVCMVLLSNRIQYNVGNMLCHVDVTIIMQPVVIRLLLVTGYVIVITLLSLWNAKTLTSVKVESYYFNCRLNKHGDWPTNTVSVRWR